jgi:subtilisin
MITAENVVRKQSYRPALLVVALAVMCALLTAPGSAQAASGDYIVILRDGVSVQAHLKALKITPNRVYAYGATGYEAVLNDTQYQRELASPDVTIVTPNSVVTTIPPMAKPQPGPQPPQFVTFAVRRIGALLSPTAAIDGVDTRVNVDIAIIDTGVDSTHPDLNVAGGYDCSGGNGYQDRRGHGTMVAGFAGAIDNSIGVVGVAPGARIWAIQVTNNAGTITDGAVLCAVDWVTAHASTIEVANMSLGGPSPATDNCGIAVRKKDGDPLHAAICASVAAGVTYVVSAGNDSVDASGITPASYPEVITVSAMADTDGQPGGLGPAVLPGCEPGTPPDDTFATFSNFGPVVDISAPGVCVTSTYPGGLYANGSGTSFAAPLVSGAAALYISTHPGATPAQVRTALLAATEPGPITGDPDTYPEGIVNVSSF